MRWKTIVSKKMVDFPLFKVFKDRVKLPNGAELNYHWIEKTPVVVVLPIFSNRIMMVKQYRYPIRSYSLELPAGHIKANETPEECAIRELKEETGFTTNKIKKLLSYNPSTEYSDQIYHIFIARDLVEGKPNREFYEVIDVELLPMDTVIKKILDGTITDGRTITAVFMGKFMNKL